MHDKKLFEIQNRPFKCGQQGSSFGLDSPFSPPKPFSATALRYNAFLCDSMGLVRVEGRRGTRSWSLASTP
jgi:hypothetical protein